VTDLVCDVARFLTYQEASPRHGCGGAHAASNRFRYRALPGVLECGIRACYGSGKNAFTDIRRAVATTVRRAEDECALLTAATWP